MTLWLLPVTLAVVLESPLKSVVLALLSWLVTKRKTTLPVGSGTTEGTSTVRHGDVNLLQQRRQQGCGQQLRLPPRAKSLLHVSSRYIIKEEEKPGAKPAAEEDKPGPNPSPNQTEEARKVEGAMAGVASPPL